MTRVADILLWMDKTYPFALAEEYDNCGLLLGSAEREVKACAVALDATMRVADETVGKGAQLLITHHPLLFSPVKCVLSGDVSYFCIRNGLSVIASHTCLDKAEGGVNDVLAERLGLQNVSLFDPDDPLLRVGELPEPMEPLDFARHCKAALHGGGVRVAPGNKLVRRVALCSGAGGDFWEQAAKAGCDALLTGEVKHHEAVGARNAGLTLVDAGHFETETVVVPELIRRLTAAFPNVRFFEPDANRPILEWL